MNDSVIQPGLMVLGMLLGAVLFRWGMSAGSQVSKTGTLRRQQPSATAEMEMLEERGQIKGDDDDDEILD